MATLEELKRTQDLLQRAHDYVELHGFDIDTYTPDTYDWDDETGRYTGDGPCCFIGTLRLAAGVNPEPSTLVYGATPRGGGGGGYDPAVDAGADDGAELRLALEALDNLVRDRLTPADRGRMETFAATTGRYIERYGLGELECNPRSISTWDDEEDEDGNVIEEQAIEPDQQATALEFFRDALRNVHQEIEAMEGAAA